MLVHDTLKEINKVFDIKLDTDSMEYSRDEFHYFLLLLQEGNGDKLPLYHL